MTTPDKPSQRTAERYGMVETQLQRRGIHDDRVLSAMRRIPREQFVLRKLSDHAYADAALTIECGQTISQPYMVARMTELLELAPEDRVLEIGTGSGYQTAVLAALAAHVYTIEWHADLMDRARTRLAALGFENVTYHCGDGSLGWPEQAPFAGILVTAGAPQIPEHLGSQLIEGGRLVVPVGDRDSQTLLRLRKTPAGLSRESLFECRFVKLRGEQGWQ